METTPRFQKALTFAKESISRFGHSHITSGHLVLGLLMLRSGVPYSVLGKAGLSVESVEGYLSSLRFCSEAVTMRSGVPFGRSASDAITRAEAEARSMQMTYLGTDHLLLGILAEKSGNAADLLASVHINQDEMSR